MPSPLKLPANMRSRIYLPAPVADEFRKLCRLVKKEPDVLLSSMIADYIRTHGTSPDKKK